NNDKTRAFTKEAECNVMALNLAAKLRRTHPRSVAGDIPPEQSLMRDLPDTVLIPYRAFGNTALPAYMLIVRVRYIGRAPGQNQEWQHRKISHIRPPHSIHEPGVQAKPLGIGIKQRSSTPGQV
ncbi:MAG: hypothetical protein VX741_09110, partial [Pseudomonadota bacterium]|nr:hypothetical protein [Pseudomonadota bacterium]